MSCGWMYQGKVNEHPVNGKAQSHFGVTTHHVSVPRAAEVKCSFCGRSSVVELLPSKQNVVSSNLIVRSKYRASSLMVKAHAS